MEKDFDAWNSQKKHLNLKDSAPFFKEREIWHCNLGENIGHEEDGKGDYFVRPVVIFRKFNSNICWVIPLTYTIKNLPFYFNFYITYKYATEIDQSSAILSQMRLVDARRLRGHAGFILHSDFIQLTKKFTALLP